MLLECNRMERHHCCACWTGKEASARRLTAKTRKQRIGLSESEWIVVAVVLFEDITWCGSNDEITMKLGMLLQVFARIDSVGNLSKIMTDLLFPCSRSSFQLPLQTNSHRLSTVLGKCLRLWRLRRSFKISSLARSF